METVPTVSSLETLERGCDDGFDSVSVKDHSLSRAKALYAGLIDQSMELLFADVHEPSIFLWSGMGECSWRLGRSSAIVLVAAASSGPGGGVPTNVVTRRSISFSLKMLEVGEGSRMAEMPSQFDTAGDLELVIRRIRAKSATSDGRINRRNNKPEADGRANSRKQQCLQGEYGNMLLGLASASVNALACHVTERSLCPGAT